ncbi:4Fe-4S dicluster domain-containing protein [candidate division KSB1 bacterium]|nr:4Fe-4S dicluster domain-containing protein [candidate division KSB1 bacterium]
MSQVTLIIDEKPITVDEGTFLYEAIRELGIEIPAPCRYPFLAPRPACRLCVCEVYEGKGPSKIVTSCNYPVKAGMVVHTDTQIVSEARRTALINLIQRCAPNRLLAELSVDLDIAQPDWGHKHVTCIFCKLCIRACDELVGAHALSFKRIGPEDTTPIKIDPAKCILCGACAFVCPTEHIHMEDIEGRPLQHHDLRLGPNAAITLSFRQAVPNVPRIHPEDCIHFEIGGCKVCSEVCPKDCIHYDQQDEFEDVEVGAIVVATGFQDFGAGAMKQYGYGQLSNVMSALEFEKMNNAAGPTGGRILMENGREPRSIAILHCIGSRDQNHHKYCSRVCCMYALKFAHLVREKTEADVYEFYIDLRAYGKGYEEFYSRILDEGVNIIRGKGAEVVPADSARKSEGDLLVRCEDTLVGKYREVPVDMVILCTALEARSDAKELARVLNISTGADGWFIEAHPKLAPVSTTTDGVFLAGACQSPKDIPDTVAQGGAAAAQAMKLMNKGEVLMDAAYAEIMEQFCSGCRICNGLCPYSAISYDDQKRVSFVNPAMCKACGTCVAACPAGAIAARHFSDDQIYAQIEGIFA